MAAKKIYGRSSITFLVYGLAWYIMGIKGRGSTLCYIAFDMKAHHTHNAWRKYENMKASEPIEKQT